MKKILFFIVSIQLVLIAVLIRNILLVKQNKVLGSVNINPIKEENIVFPEDSELKYFYEPKPNTTEREQPEWLDYEAVYNFNADSLNERYDYSVEKPQNTFRIVVLGDSFSFGLFVSTEDNYPEVLEDKLKELSCKSYENFEVINLAERGYGIEYSVEKLIRRGIKYQPDLVIWLINEWNITRMNELVTSRVEEIVNEATTSGKFDDLVKEKGRYFHWIQAQQELVDSIGLDKIVDMQVKNIDDLRKAYTGKMVIAFFSDHLTVDHMSRFVNGIKEKHQDFFFYSDMNVSDLETLKVDFHPSKKDYQIISGKLKDFIAENLVSCD